MKRPDQVAWLRRRLDDLPQLASAHEVPGVSVAVLVDGQVVQGVAGVTNLRTGVEVTPDTLFMIQSITKVWTATLVMQLVDEGSIELDAPVRSYLPEFRTADARASEQITVRHLLTHSGGFEGDIWAATTCGPDALQRFVTDLVCDAPQHFAPGAMYSYCNAGYGVLGRLVEVLRGLPYSQASRRFLAEPLGIDELAFDADEALAFRTAIGHVRPHSQATTQPLPRWAVLPPSNPAAGNQLAMSARALLAFGAMHVTNRAGVLTPAAVQAMRTQQVDHLPPKRATCGHGLGWMLSQCPGVIEHGGDAPGVAALLSVVPEQGVAVAVLTNGGAANRLVDELVDPVLEELAGVAPYRRDFATPPPEPVRDPLRYAGRYQDRVVRNEVTADDDGRLWLTRSDRNEAIAMFERAGIVPESERHELRRLDANTFVTIDDSGAVGRTVEFVGGDAAGRARFLHTGRAVPRVE